MHGTCSNYTNLLRLLFKKVIPNLQNYWTDYVLVSKLNLILQPNMPWQILIFLTDLKTVSDHIWQIIWLVSRIWKWWIMLPTRCLQFMLLMEERMAAKVLFSITWVMILISQSWKLEKKFLNFWLVLECNWLIIWMLKVSCVIAQKVLWNMFAFVLQPTLLKMEEPYMPNLKLKNQVTKGKSDSLPRELPSCVPMLAKARKFSYPLHGKSKSNLIFCELQQFPIGLAHATTVDKTHKSTIQEFHAKFPLG